MACSRIIKSSSSCSTGSLIRSVLSSVSYHVPFSDLTWPLSLAFVDRYVADLLMPPTKSTNSSSSDVRRFKSIDYRNLRSPQLIQNQLFPLHAHAHPLSRPLHLVLTLILSSLCCHCHSSCVLHPDFGLESLARPCHTSSCHLLICANHLALVSSERMGLLLIKLFQVELCSSAGVESRQTNQPGGLVSKGKGRDRQGAAWDRTGPESLFHIRA